MLSEAQVQIISQRIEVARGALNEAMLAEHYRNPFWEARYGESGRQRTREDQLFQFKYLFTALSAGDPSIFTDYWKWLRPVLVLRGMCTRHAHDTITLTERHLRPVIADFWAEVAHYFSAAYAALAYDHPACQALNRVEEQTAAAVCARLRTERPGCTWVRCQADTLYFLSYLQDAAANQNPLLFREHIHWMRGFLVNQGLDPADLELALTLLRAEITAALPEQAGVFLEMF